jgi:hypothetical protein
VPATRKKCVSGSPTSFNRPMWVILWGAFKVSKNDAGVWSLQAATTFSLGMR